MSALNSRVLVVVPITTFALSVALVNVNGPFYVGGHIDPEYVELGNSLSALMFHVPVSLVHPGTTLHVLGALVILCKWLLSTILAGPWQPIELAVFGDPEGFLHAINLAINVLIALSMYYAAREIYRYTGSLIAALVLQLSFFLFPENLKALTRVSPEPLLVAFIFALMIPLIRLVFGGEVMTESDTVATVIWAGIILGAGVVTKANLLPFASVVLVIKGYKHKVWFILSAIMGVLLFLFPSLSRLPEIVGYFVSFETHAGFYAGGAAGLPEAEVLKHNLSAFYASAPFLSPLLILYAVALTLVLVRTRREGSSSKVRIVPLLTAGFIGLFLHTALTVQHFQTHYLIPSLVFTSLLNAVLVAQWQTAGFRTAPKMGVLLLAAGLGLVCIAYSARTISGWADSMRWHREEVALIMDQMNKRPDCARVGYYLSSLPIFALDFANFMAGHHHTTSLSRLYPEAIFYDPAHGRFGDFSGEDKSSAVVNLLEKGQCIMAEGQDLPASEMRLPPTLGWDRIYARSGEAVYSLTLNTASDKEHAKN